MKKLSVLFVLLLMLSLSGCGNQDRDVSISLPSGQYYGELHVTLECPDPNAQITYTLDGSDPGQSNLIYDKETGITISYTSDLKATAGANVAEAHYDIIPYSSVKDAAAQAFFDAAQGDYSTSVAKTDNFILKNSTVTFEKEGQPTVTSGYALTDVNGNNATLIYTDAQGNNQRIPLEYNPSAYSILVNGQPYTRDWYLEQQSEDY